MDYKTKAFSCNSIEGGWVELCFDRENDSVNKLCQKTLEDLNHVIDLMSQDTEIKGLLIRSAKDNFIVGADVNEFLSFFAMSEEELNPWLQSCQKIFTDLENLEFPKVSLMNGYALGGGFELCLSTEFRIASPDVKMGFPEVKLGILPGFGGISRFPRLVGADNALEWIAAGDQHGADNALETGAIDAIVAPEKLREAGLDLLERVCNGELDWRKRREEKRSPLLLNEIERTMVFEGARAFIAGKAGHHYPAPLTIVGVMQAAATLPLDAALEVEAEGFAELATGSVAHALVGLFLGDQVLKAKVKSLKKEANPVEHAAVLGAGIMGGGIAYQSASKGTPIVMKDIAHKALDAGLEEASRIMEKRIQRGKMDAARMSSVLRQITPTLSYDGLKDVDLVVEAVIENESIKKTVLSELEDSVSPETIITSNTSTIQITGLSEGMKHPERFCGMHFFNPVHRMPLVEVIRGKHSSEKAVATTVAYAASLGKSPIVVNDCPGFLINRVLFPYFAGFTKLINEGVDYVRIDKVMEGFGWPMGPAFLLDVVGMDTAYHARSVMAVAFPDRMKSEVPTAIDLMFDNQRLGKKNNKGFYQHTTDKKGRPKKSVDESTRELMRDLSVSESNSKDIGNEEIIERMMLPMLMESVRCLEENIVESAAEVDMGLIYGLGFPPFLGGIFRYADQLGLENICKRAEHYAPLGKLYEAPAMLQEKAKSGVCFY